MSVQEVAEVFERTEATLAAMQVELGKAPQYAQLQLIYATAESREQGVSARIVEGGFHQVVAGKAEVGCCQG